MEENTVMVDLEEALGGVEGIIETGKISKSDLVDIISGTLNYSKKDVRDVVNCLFNTISDLIVGGNVVTIQNFGRFYIRTAKPRTFKRVGAGINGTSSAEIFMVGERNLPKIRFSRELVNRVKATQVE